MNEKKIDGISNINDESDRSGMRIVIDFKKDAIANVVLNTLLKHTALQTSFGVNNIALVGRYDPVCLNLKDYDPVISWNIVMMSLHGVLNLN